MQHWVAEIVGPNEDGNYKAWLNNADTITFGPVQDPKHYDPEAPEAMWYVSVGPPFEHTTFIVRCEAIGEPNSQWMIKAIKAKGDDKEAWKLIASSLASRPPR